MDKEILPGKNKFIRIAVWAAVQLVVFAFISIAFRTVYGYSYLIAALVGLAVHFYLEQKELNTRALILFALYHVLYTALAAFVGNGTVERLGMNGYIVLIIAVLMDVAFESEYSRLVVYGGKRKPENIAKRIIKKYGGEVNGKNFGMLAEEEKTVCAVLSFVQECEEGGFLKYFIGSGTVTGSYILKALDTVGRNDDAEKISAYCRENGIDLDDLSKFNYEAMGADFDVRLLKNISDLEELVDVHEAEKALGLYTRKKEKELSELNI